MERISEHCLRHRSYILKTVLVLDAQGGGLGKMIISALREKSLGIRIIAVGTNAQATATMIKAGADEGATGENSVVVTAKSADVIVGPLGIVVADSMLGEITPKMAKAVGKSDAKRVLIPMNQCSNIVVGLEKIGVKELVSQAVVAIEKILTE